MPADRRVDFFNQLPAASQKLLLPALAQAERENILNLAAYPPGTAGAVMTSDYATLLAELTTSKAIAQSRREVPDRETIYYTYVVDADRRLIGFVSLKDLILANPDRLVANITRRDVIHSRVTDDQEDTALKIQKYDLIALPVVYEDNILVGIITHDDAIDIFAQEHTEDNEITPRDIRVVLFKDGKVAILLGILLGIFSFARQAVSGDLEIAVE